MELHILVTQWTIIDSHWKRGKNPWRLSFSDILPNALLSRSFVLFNFLGFSPLVSRPLFHVNAAAEEDFFFFNDWENLFTAPAYEESVQGQICLRYLTRKP